MAHPEDKRGLKPADRIDILKYDKERLQKELDEVRRDKQDLESRLVLALRCLSVFEKLADALATIAKQGKAPAWLLMIAPYLALAGVVPYLLTRGTV